MCLRSYYTCVWYSNRQHDIWNIVISCNRINPVPTYSPKIEERYPMVFYTDYIYIDTDVHRYCTTNSLLLKLASSFQSFISTMATIQHLAAIDFSIYWFLLAHYSRLLRMLREANRALSVASQRSNLRYSSSHELGHFIQEQRKIISTFRAQPWPMQIKLAALK